MKKKVYPEFLGSYANFKGGSEKAKEKELQRLEKLFGKYDNQNDDNSIDTANAILDEIQLLDKLQSV